MYTTKTKRPCAFKDRLHWPFTISRCYAHSFYAKWPCSFGIGLWPTTMIFEVFLVPLKLSLFWYNGCLSPELYSSCIKLGGAFAHDSRLTINWIGFLLMIFFFSGFPFFAVFVVIGGKKVVTFFHFRSLSWALSSDFSSFSSFYFSYRFCGFLTLRFSLKLFFF